MSDIVMVRIRGSFHLRKDVDDTLRMLGLAKKNWCVIKKDSPSLQGMLHKVKDFITWGFISDETRKSLGTKGTGPFALHPPRKGYGRKGIKVAFKVGGALGDRQEKINDLIGRMIV